MGSRYNRVAMSLHWLIALAIIGNLLLGWWMHDAIEQASQRALAAQAFQWHKSIGLSILLLSVLRLLWRLGHRAPPLPPQMPAWERRAAQLTHIALYSLMLLVPLSGWLYVSTQWRGDTALSVPTLFFGWFEVPHLFGLHTLAAEQRQWWAEISFLTHEWLASGMAALLLLHIAAALKHQFVSHDDVLQRMLPRHARSWVLGALAIAGLAAVLLQTADFKARSLSSDSQIRSSASGWQVQPDDSVIAFSGVHADEAFEGRFLSWWADLQLNATQPEASSLRALIDTASAHDGQILHEETLPQAEWFNVEQFPQAEFTSTSVRADGQGGWLVDGELRIKDQRHPVSPLRLRFEGQRARLNADITVDRADFNLGMESDPKGEWVSRKIGIRIQLLASAP